ncbi:hypothetical protein FE257_010216 [Aspergillus nanangensis]|uniref:Cytochrome P450 n=1 Tax=Aspergillus nanangensis TaxID=2582783 RepID=A0AAD4CIV2_ASPNN|nr:hypothetical protein FE257_010216 [Aspergillus nanangensis]
MSPSQLPLFTALTYFILSCLYDIFLHSLARFPGPLYHRASILPWAYLVFRGTLAFQVVELHNKYGPVVRLSPSHLGFSDPQAWKDVFGVTPGGENLKYRGLYRSMTSGVSDSFLAADTAQHRYMRGLVAPGFTARSIVAQEGQIMAYVDLLMYQLRNRSTNGSVMDVSQWFNWTTFDVICDLTLGDSLHCLENAETHMYLKFTHVFSEYSMKGAVLWHLGRNIAFTRSSNVSVCWETGENFRWHQSALGPQEVIGTANLFMVAGSDTTASSLTFFTYYMVTNTGYMSRLTDEIGSTFESDDQIDLDKTASLPYLNACIKEMQVDG